MPAFCDYSARRELTVAEIREILGDEAAGLSDEQVLRINAECLNFASMVCDLAMAGPVAKNDGGRS